MTFVFQHAHQLAMFFNQALAVLAFKIATNAPIQILATDALLHQFSSDQHVQRIAQLDNSTRLESVHHAQQIAEYAQMNKFVLNVMMAMSFPMDNVS